MAKYETVDAYIATLDGWQHDVVATLRGIIREVAPEALEAIKWSQPVYEINGPFCYLKAYKNNVNFGFWRGAELEDRNGLLEGSGAKMRHVKLTDTQSIDRDAFAGLVREAGNLNLEKGDPTKGG